MKKYIHSLFILLLVISSNESLGNEKEKFVNDLISKMTLEEKVGQMTQINLTVIAKGPNRFSSSFPMEIDDSRANKALVDFKVGSVLIQSIIQHRNQVYGLKIFQKFKRLP